MAVSVVFFLHGTAGGIGEREVDRLVAFHQRVVGDRHGERLAGLAGGEVERAERTVLFNTGAGVKYLEAFRQH